LLSFFVFSKSIRHSIYWCNYFICYCPNLIASALHGVCCKSGGRNNNGHFIATGLLFGLDEYPFGFCLLAFTFYLYSASVFSGRNTNASPAASLYRWLQG